MSYRFLGMEVGRSGLKWSEVNYNDGMNTDVVKYWNSKGEPVTTYEESRK